MRKYLIILLTFIMMLMTATLAHAAPNVTLNEQALTFDVPPAIESGRTLVPLRAIFEALGARISWDDNSQTVTATKGNTEIKLVIGGQAYKNGQPAYIEVPAKVIDGRTMVPLRFVSEAMGCQVGWNGDTQTITITSSSTGTVTVHFIDAGQADAIYISLPDKNDILIDAGNEADGQTVTNYLKSKSVDDIELLIATHPHEDHIGGLPAVLDAFMVERIIDSGHTANTNIYKEYVAKATAEGATWEADNRQTLTFGNTVLQIPTGTETWQDTNDYSVVCRLDTGNIEFLFTGDAEGPAEAALSGDLSAEILKAGHHGSLTPSSGSFIGKVNPEVAIISVGTGNSYGHPAAETVQRFNDAGVTVYRTDTSGNITVSGDDKSYTVSTDHKLSVAVPTPQVPQQTQTQVQPIPEPAQAPASEGRYVGSAKSDKYHYPTCRYADKIAPENQVWFKDATEAQAAGYSPCGVCKP